MFVHGGVVAGLVEVGWSVGFEQELPSRRLCGVELLAGVQDNRGGGSRGFGSVCVS